jgi:hypothetical protein
VSASPITSATSPGSLPVSRSIRSVRARTAAIVRPYSRSTSGRTPASVSSASSLPFLQIGVFTPPGSITMTSTPCGRSSRRSASLIPSRPNFEAL